MVPEMPTRPGKILESFVLPEVMIESSVLSAAGLLERGVLEPFKIALKGYHNYKMKYQSLWYHWENLIEMVVERLTE